MKKGIIIFLVFGMVFACAKKEDEEIYNEVSSATYTYFDNGAILNPLGGSPHGDFKLKFNSIAQAALDANGELPVGESFPLGSILVKEALNSNGEVTLLVVMKKDPDNKNAELGWVWAEYEPNGKVVISASDKGQACVSCHNSGTHRDYVRTFDLH